VFEIARSADHRYSPIGDGDGSVLQNTGVAHLLSLSRSGRTGAGHDLGRVNEEKVCQGNGGTREAGGVPVIARTSG
jgi:hypothetical protein